jgi:translation initiation factor 1
MGLFAGTKWDVPAKCDRCQKLEADCSCPPVKPPAKDPATQTVRVHVEKRKGGRFMTIISGFSLDDQGLAELLTQAKNHCGAGGSREGDQLTVQGDQQTRISQWLQGLGYKVK